MSIRQLILGSPLPTIEHAHQRLSKVKALAVFSSDALSSVAYATEEILLVLITAGMAALEFSVPIALVITGLLVIVAASYYQTIHDYPSGGGGYIVAHENLRRLAWTYRGCIVNRLCPDGSREHYCRHPCHYLLPHFFSLSLPGRDLCLSGITLIAGRNLRGVRESGHCFRSQPTPLFLRLLPTIMKSGFAAS